MDTLPQPGDTVESLLEYEENGGARIRGTVSASVRLETGHTGLFVKDAAGREWWLHADAVRLIP
jgi:hypothetical protein